MVKDKTMNEKENGAFMRHMHETGIVPVVVLDDAQNAVRTAKALLAGGIDFMEVTFRTEAAADAIREIAGQVPKMNVGAGTVLHMEQCIRALDAGAKFVVSPGFSEEIVRYCTRKNVPVLPGCVTPTEITAALSFGISAVKFFPAKIYGGSSAVKALHEPFEQVCFLPTGGVNADNMDEYLRLPYVLAVGGSWVCTREDIREGRFEKIERLSEVAVQQRRAFYKEKIINIQA
jgi:2-dehydro-3-deoxyphosphogluconate aldolase/(4S)-4-hydroxy-2-oxoglutarate aldolase